MEGNEGRGNMLQWMNLSFFVIHKQLTLWQDGFRKIDALCAVVETWRSHLSHENLRCATTPCLTPLALAAGADLTAGAVSKYHSWQLTFVQSLSGTGNL
jgi:hypothetical protein